MTSVESKIETMDLHDKSMCVSKRFAEVKMREMCVHICVGMHPFLWKARVPLIILHLSFQTGTEIESGAH